METTIITQCTCGSFDFWLTETITHHASIDELDGKDDNFTLHASGFADNEISSIICKQCNKEYETTDFNDIEFN